MFQVRTKIVYNKRVKNNYFALALKAPRIVRRAQPGQFVQIKVNAGFQPLLRRPFGIHSVKGKRIEVLYEVLGPGTQILSQKKPGDFLDIIGPLGNGFNYRLAVSGSRLAVLVSGGMGIAPLVFLAEKLIYRKPQTANRKPLVLIGAKTKSQILCEKEFKRLGCDVKISTDDGSLGFRGKITDLLKKLLRNNELTKQRVNDSTIYACGPRPMLKEVSAVAKKYNIPAQLSLEEHMVCGIGACLGCTVNTREGYQRACKEGPVFNAQEIIW